MNKVVPNNYIFFCLPYSLGRELLLSKVVAFPLFGDGDITKVYENQKRSGLQGA